MTNWMSISLVAILGVIGNIAYFEYRLKKEHRKEISKEQLTKLLLPLYIIFKTDELVMTAVINDDNCDPYEYEADKPERLINPVKEILDKYLYLSDDELQMNAISFLEWAYKEDCAKRFNDIHYNALEQDKIEYDFRALIYKKYNEQKKKYLK